MKMDKSRTKLYVLIIAIVLIVVVGISGTLWYLAQHDWGGTGTYLELRLQKKEGNWSFWEVTQVGSIQYNKDLSKLQIRTYGDDYNLTKNRVVTLEEAKQNYLNTSYQGNIMYIDKNNDNRISLQDIIRIKNNGWIDIIDFEHHERIGGNY